MKTVSHEADLCVVGGGIAGMCAAIAAARHGARVILMHDRPVLGGNASSEIRMHLCGAHGANKRETGIVEEIEMENMYRNPRSNFSIWDSVLHEKAKFQDNLTTLLNCSCNAAEMDGSKISSISGWQLTTETTHTVKARFFADCSGDSILAPLSGAEFRIGREASSEFDEDIEPPVADKKTMGMSCLIQARETTEPHTFIPPKWAHKFESCDDLPNRGHILAKTNFWWIELGGEDDSIHDSEDLRDELLKIAFGVWDHIKNHCTCQNADNWVLDWLGFLPGKRESRRYVGDHMLTQNDVRAEGRFDDMIAYGGWSMDDHTPGGFRDPGKPTIFHPAPSPYGIPYRCVYSRNIENLFCAGRNISATHAAMSSTRVIATCATLGQAAGTAAAIAVRENTTPRGVYENHTPELKQALMDDDCYLPWNTRRIPALSAEATLSASVGNPETLRNGIDRPVGEDSNAWVAPLGEQISYDFGSVQAVTEARLVFDSNLNRREKNMHCFYPLSQGDRLVAESMVRAFRIEAHNGDSNWQTIFHETNNYQRLVRVPLNTQAAAIRFIPEQTWGADSATVFAFDLR